MRLAYAWLVALASVPGLSPAPALELRGAPAPAQIALTDAVTGTWDGLYEPPGTVGGQPFALLLELASDAKVAGRLLTAEARYPLEGSFDATRGRLSLEGSAPDGDTLALDLAVETGRLSGEVARGSFRVPFEARRASQELLERDLVPPTLSLERERPATFTQVGLPDELGLAIDDLLLDFCRRNGVVGLSVSIVLDGTVADVRSLGWEDLERDVPASGDTQYRWASISKPLTAVTAVLMADTVAFDLERDVRAWVPEFPDKDATITPLSILCHQSGIVHYDGAIRSWQRYEVSFPFEDRIVALDIFKESPLRSPPGKDYGYSTHAYSLLGAAMQRAGGKRYEELVSALVLEPLGMRATFPDFKSREIPHRTQGYRPAEGGVKNAGDDDISWKLPGGGWTSTVGDMARFAAGLLGDELLSAEQKELLWTRRTTADAQATPVGLGFFIEELGGRRSVQHGGAQRKTSTFMNLLPEEGMAVVLMSNTERTDLSDLAPQLLRLLVTNPR